MEKRGNMRRKDTFTHFMSIPFISEKSREILKAYQKNVEGCFVKEERQALQRNDPNLFHITLCMLSLDQNTRPKAKAIYQRLAPKVIDLLKGTDLACSELRHFYRGTNQYENVNVLFLDLVEDDSYKLVLKCADLLIREFLKEEIFTSDSFRSMRLSYDHREDLYKPDKLHLTMFRVNQDKSKYVDWKTALQYGKKVVLKERLPIEYVDVSTRFDYDQTKFYTPLVRINIPTKNEQPKVNK